MMFFWKEASMNTPRKSLILAAAVLALHAAPGLAAQMIDETPTAAAAASVHGVVQKGSTDTMLRVNGKTYVVSPTSTVFYGAGGLRVAAPRLSEGKSVAFNLVAGSTVQIKELWIDA